MRKFLYFILFVVFASANAQAQSLNDLFRSLIGGSAEASEPAKVVFPSEDELLGGWVYKSLDMEYGGSDVLASMAVLPQKVSCQALLLNLALPRDVTTSILSAERQPLSAERGRVKQDTHIFPQQAR